MEDCIKELVKKVECLEDRLTNMEREKLQMTKAKRKADIINGIIAIGLLALIFGIVGYMELLFRGII